jgi:diacylglycerol kinase family enzyme
MPVERWALVVNPTKFDDLEALEDRVHRYCAENGWPEPLWYETTSDDPGAGQARDAVVAGAQVVCPLGGDGTVRAVASGLIDAQVPMGLLPGGTGNLLARNLGLAIDDLETALTVALTGRDADIDVGEVSWDGGEPDIFLVMSGMGLDAEIMAEVDEGLKRRVGWWAYVLSGVGAIFRLGFAVRVHAGGDRQVFQHARTVLVANCGELTGGLRLVPEAEVDDGLLDVVLATPRSLPGWLAIALHFVSASRRGHGPLVHLQDRQVTVRTAEPVAAQLDGDAVGAKRLMTCRVRPGALTVRLPTAVSS